MFTNIAKKRCGISDFEYFFIRRKIKEYCTELFPSAKYPELGVDKIIYFSQSPEKCLQNIRLRGRTEEENTSLLYLKDIKEEYDKILSLFEQTDVLIINSPCDESDVEPILVKISQFLQAQNGTTNELV